VSHPRLPFLLRPYIYHELPGWGGLMRKLHVLGIDNTDARWREAPVKTIRGKGHGYLMKLDLRDDFDRMTYFLGRYYDLNVQSLLDVLLGAGDTYIDVGANVGHHVLYAAARVGETGSVIAFEPQPGCCERIREHLRDNQIEHVELHQMGLSDEPDELELKLLGGGTVMASFAIDPEADTWVRNQIKVPVGRGDDVLPDDSSGGVVLKIDVEGYELCVLRGMTKTIEAHRPLIITEFNSRFFERAGVDPQDAIDFFHGRKYQAYDIGMARSKLTKPKLKLKSISTLEDMAEIKGVIDLLWIPEENTEFDPSPYF